MLDQQSIAQQVKQQAGSKHVWLAYSGGVDSHVLLHILAQSQQFTGRLHAIYIDHGLQTQSEQWGQHCQRVAADLGVDCTVIAVTVEDIEQLGLEAAARHARYKALGQHLSENDLLLTAQHQEDQAETLLLQLFRGAGPKGLASMAESFELAQTAVYRPLLSQSQQAILSYARNHQLNWIEDPSNQEQRWGRNYIRHTLWPLIYQRWPSAASTLSRSARHCAETDALLEEIAQADLVQLYSAQDNQALAIDQLMALSEARRNNVLRYYIQTQGLQAPSTINLQRIIDEVCLAKSDSEPLVCWQGVEVRRYQNHLYIMPPLTAHDSDQQYRINSLDKIRLEGLTIEWQPSENGLTKDMIKAGVWLKFRQGGERIKPAGSQHHKTLKHLFQQWAVAPWQRQRIPLFFIKDKLVIVAGYCFSDLDNEQSHQPRYLPVIKLAD